MAQEKNISITKKTALRSVIAESSDWAQESLLLYSKRKQKEADRLVEQAQRGATLQRMIKRFTSRIISREARVLKQKRRLLDTEHRLEMLEMSEHWYQFLTLNSNASYEKDLEGLKKANAEQQRDNQEARQMQGKDEENIREVTQQLEKSMEALDAIKVWRSKWSPIEETYAMSSLTEEDEDVVFTSQLRGLLGQLDDSFCVLSSHLSEEDNALRHASNQVEIEAQSIQSFISRMESEEDTLTETEKEALEKENDSLTTENQLIRVKSKILIAEYKKLQDEHAELFEAMNAIRQKKHDASQVSLPTNELEFVKQNLGSPELPVSFVQKFRLPANEFQTLAHVLNHLDQRLQVKFIETSKWFERSRASTNALKKIKIKFQDANWEHDMLTKIPAVADIEQKMNNTKKNRTEVFSPKEEWLSDLILLKRSLMSKDHDSIQKLDEAIMKLGKEETKMKEKEKMLTNGQIFVQKTRRTKGLENFSSSTATVHGSTHDKIAPPPPQLSVTSSYISKYTTKGKVDLTKDGDDLGSIERAAAIDRNSDASIEM